MRRRWMFGAAVIGLALLAAACPADTDGGTQGQADQGNVLQDVIDRGTLRCGVNDTVPGFGFRTAEGEFEGFDPDFCRAVAAAVLGEADAVEFVPLSATDRFTALQAGDIDVLIRNTTWTAGRDGGEGAAFVTTTFYDAQDMMVQADSPYETLEDMANTTICVLAGTTTESNLEDEFRFREIPYEPRTFDSPDIIRETFLEEGCDGWTSDRSQLFAFKGAWPADRGGPEALRLLDVTISKEPLGPAVADGDSTWFDAVNWAVIATMQAEEFGITSENVDDFRDEPGHPSIARFLGVEAEGADPFDAGIDLPSDFAYQVISQVGNYEEIFDGNIGPGTTVNIEDRGPNALWTDGGLIYPPPYR